MCRECLELARANCASPGHAISTACSTPEPLVAVCREDAESRCGAHGPRDSIMKPVGGVAAGARSLTSGDDDTLHTALYRLRVFRGRPLDRRQYREVILGILSVVAAEYVCSARKACLLPSSEPNRLTHHPKPPPQLRTPDEGQDASTFSSLVHAHTMTPAALSA